MRDSIKRMMVLMLTGILMPGIMAGCSGRGDGLTLDRIRQEEQEETDEAYNMDAAAETGEASENDAGIAQDEKDSEGVICVFVCGQVVSPGVYEFPAGSRIYQAVEAAGGMLEAADEAFVNQAELMEDGQRIYIPSVEEVLSGELEETGDEARGSSDGISSDGRVNINTASKEELMTLTGIGEKKADAIIQYRDTNGGFQTKEELMQVAGIKEGTFEKIKEDIEI